MKAVLLLKPGELARFVEIERVEAARRRIARGEEPPFLESRDLVPAKARPGKARLGELVPDFIIFQWVAR